ncbi:cilia- and flagella-associated protein 410-like isoform X1 [Phymastichus coffea]|uniref:cilia- and flagella-associated protein 410-like isoform X1 n=1 Tax=Phymastichus coffea TaxID=108790 RepID=UPI00273CE186|nr:cilia- and flagella-associated protein 410-like isoform X1 [Phymastichus coffea]
MVRLTEEMVAARTRVSDCSAVKKLNCWGTELTDVSILRKMTNVEVLSLSVNNINSLADFQNCLNLKDLFVRRNKIRDLNEVCFLQRLPNLRNLWLGENPCADVEGYRLAVIKALPNLEKLDEKIVTPEEVQTAMLRGKALVHPLSTMQEEPLSPQSGHGSPEVVMAKYSEEQDMDERRNYSSSDDQRSYDEPPSVDDYQETDKRNANYNTSPVHQYSSNNRYSYEQNGRIKNTDNNLRNNSYVEISAASKILEIQQDCNERTAIPRHNGDYENQRIYTPVSPRTQYPQAEYIDERRIEYEEPQRPQSSQSKRGMMNQSMERDDFNQSTSWARRGEDKRRSQFQYQRRPVTRNSNILSAVLCLVKELDYPSLEVVEMAVRSRIEELEE